MQSFRIVLTAVAFAISLPAMADSTHDFAECTMDAIEAAGASPFTESESQEVDAGGVSPGVHGLGRLYAKGMLAKVELLEQIQLASSTNRDAGHGDRHERRLHRPHPTTLTTTSWCPWRNSVPSTFLACSSRSSMVTTAPQ